MIGDELLQVPGLALVVYHEGREVYRFAGGIRRFRPKPLPMAMDSRFRIASVSKMFTVFTLMQLVEEGRLSLDDDVSAYLGFRLRHPDYDDIPVTVRMLASHTSGLRDGKVYSIPPFVSAEAFFQPDSPYWEKGQHFAPPEEVPGQYFTYCNLNYGLLGTLIEAVTGQRFDDYQKGHILKDLDCRGDYVPGNLPQAEFEKLGTITARTMKAAAGRGGSTTLKAVSRKKRRLPFKTLMQKRSVRPISWMGTGPGPMPPFFRLKAACACLWLKWGRLSR